MVFGGSSQKNNLEHNQLSPSMGCVQWRQIFSGGGFIASHVFMQAQILSGGELHKNVAVGDL